MKYFGIITACMCIWSYGSTQQEIKFNIDGKEVFVFDSSRIGIFHNDKNTFIGYDVAANNAPNSLTLAGTYNTFVGYYSGWGNSTGYSNTFLGASTGGANNSGSFNTFLGAEAGVLNTTGEMNTYVGINAGRSPLDSMGTGSGNSFFGAYAGENIMNGSGNVGVGRWALGQTRSGIENVAIGQFALGLDTIGDGNVAIGSNALAAAKNSSFNTSIGTMALSGNEGSGNVALGYRVGANASGSNKLYIDNCDTSSTLIYGEFDNNILRVNGELQIGNQYKFPLLDDVAGKVLKTNGSGQLSWQNDDVNDADADPFNELVTSLSFSFPFLTINENGVQNMVDLSILYEDNDADASNEFQTLNVSSDSIYISAGNGVKIPSGKTLIDGNMDTRIDVEKAVNEDTIRLMVQGTDRMRLGANGTYVDNQIFVKASSPQWTHGIINAEYSGESLLDYVAVKGTSVPADYYGIGGQFEGGYKGVDAVVYATGNNTYYGVTSNVSGGAGVRYGIRSTASGAGGASYGVYAEGTGTNSYGVYGKASGLSTDVNYGIYGEAPIGISSFAGYFDGQVGITNDLYVQRSLYVTNGIGVGTLYPASPVHITDTAYADYLAVLRVDATGLKHAEAVKGVATNTSFGVGGGFEGTATGCYGRVVETSNNVRIGIYGEVSNGAGISYGVQAYATSTGTNYGVYGDAYNGNTNYALYANGDIGYTGSLVNASDRRLKKDISAINEALQIVERLAPKSYKFRTDEFEEMNLPEGAHYGFIAQEVEQVLPHLVHNDAIATRRYAKDMDRSPDQQRMKGVNYTEFIPILTKAIQELAEQNELLTRQMADLQAQLDQR